MIDAPKSPLLSRHDFPARTSPGAAVDFPGKGGLRMNKQDLISIVAEAGDLPKAKAGDVL